GKRLLKTLLGIEFGIALDHPAWGEQLKSALLARHFPGFRLKDPKARRRGAPIEWTEERLARLFADVHFLKKKRNLSVASICDCLCTNKHYKERWGAFTPAALVKAYTVASTRKDLGYELTLCPGHQVGALPAGKERINLAIEHHALREQQRT